MRPKPHITLNNALLGGVGVIMLIMVPAPNLVEGSEPDRDRDVEIGVVVHVVPPFEACDTHYKYPMSVRLGLDWGPKEFPNLP